MAQWVKDPVLSLLWRGFSPWPGNFHMPQAQPKKKKRKGIKSERPPARKGSPPPGGRRCHTCLTPGSCTHGPDTAGGGHRGTKHVGSSRVL